MTAALVRVRGRVAQDVRVAWLEVDGRWECSVADPGFEVITEDGTRTRIDLDEATVCRRFQRLYAGPWSELTEFDSDQPFRERRAEGSVEHPPSSRAGV